MRKKDFLNLFAIEFTSFDPRFERMFREMDELMREFEREFYRPWGPEGEAGWSRIEYMHQPAQSKPSRDAPSGYLKPVVDILEEGGIFRVIAEMPGIPCLEDILVRVDGDWLTIKGDGETRRYYSEVPLGRRVDDKGMESSYNNGILEVTFQHGGEGA